MLEFTDTFKIYLFKDKQKVDWSIRVSSNHVHTYSLTVEEFEGMLNNWKQPAGYTFSIGGTHAFVQHKTTTPRPESKPTSYVRITIWKGVDYQYRVDYSDMVALEDSYHHQKNNVMYWDNYGP
jgi:hypothetical protein